MTKMQTAKWALAAMIGGALLGAVPLYLQLHDVRQTADATERRLESELAELRERVAVSNAHSGLGRIMVLLENEDYAAASTLSTRVFNEIDRAIERIGDSDARRRLLTVQGQRDQMTSAIATRDENAAALARRLFRALEASVGPQ